VKLTIKSIINQKLTESIQYYIFCTSEQSEKYSYQTFPNTNLCLALYKSNKISHYKDTNYCKVEKSNSSFTSKLWGFHEKIFNVSIEAQIDQVCILFHPSGIRNFTNVPYEILVNSDDVFEMIFGKRGTDFLEQLFKTNDIKKRISLLEQFLIKNLLCSTINHLALYAVQRILQTDGDVKIDALAKELGINNATLYNNFISYIGQSPKDFIKTVRFRAALSALKKQRIVSLTDISYSANYYDQSHFIKEFRQLTSYTPKEIRNKAVVEQEKLIWVNNF
jgi:AraC-like DNA-binding protein